MSNQSHWGIYKGTKTIADLPAPPPWRNPAQKSRSKTFEPNPHDIEMVNAALYLRRPLLITGKPGIGKTSIAYAVADELGLGEVLRWSITTRSTLKEALYSYDAIARLQDAALLEKQQAYARGRHQYLYAKRSLPAISQYLRLGPLGTAFAAQDKPQVLLIDEIDKSDIDLPNDLLHVFEEGQFEIPELVRLSQNTCDIPLYQSDATVKIEKGRVTCQPEYFPLVIMTSNDEREFPPAFLRRCLRLQMELPDQSKLKRILQAHLADSGIQDYETKMAGLIEAFLAKRDDSKKDLATDQLLNAMYLTLQDIEPLNREQLLEALWQALSSHG